MRIAGFRDREPVDPVTAGVLTGDQTDIGGELLSFLKPFEIADFNDDSLCRLRFDAKETAELPHAFPISVLISQFFDTPVKTLQGIGKFIVSQKVLTKDLFIESLWFKAP